VTNDKNIGAKELRGLHLCYSLSQLGRATSTICEMYAVSRVYFCRCTISWKIAFSDRATIYQLNGVCSTRVRTRACSGRMARESIDPRSRIPFAVVHESGEAITSRDCLWISERLLFFGAASRLSCSGRPARRCVHYWIDVICSRWNCSSRGIEKKKRRKKERFQRFIRRARYRLTDA